MNNGNNIKKREVILADKAGFCFGVKRAVDTAYLEAEKAKKDNISIYTYGSIIHNKFVVDDLAANGVGMINSIEELDAIPPSRIIIRSHGVGKNVIDKIRDKGHELIDATCPFVNNIHKIAQEVTTKKETLIIIGDASHPEVQGIKGWCSEEPFIISDTEDVTGLPEINGNITVVSQTTFNSKKFKDIVELLQKKYYNIRVCNTICNATAERQEEAARLSAEVDVMIVIGDPSSSNTKKLYEISRQQCKNTYYVQTLDDLDLTVIESASRVGITAGASTPKFIIKEVHDSMSETNSEFEKLLQEEDDFSIRTGQIVDGTVIGVKPEEIIVDIHYKSEGIVTREEYSNTPNIDLTTVVKEGDPITVKVIKTNDGEGQVVLSYKRIAAEKAYAKLEEAFNNQEVLKGTVAQALNGGLSVLVDECKVFIPASLVSDAFERDLKKYEGQEVEFILTEFNTQKRRFIGNRKKLIVEKKEALAKELFGRIEVGQTVEGTVKNVTNFGAFIDLGGADGLLHISEMSWGRVDNPKKIFNVGDKVKAFIKDINGDKIALSLKFDDQNPWLTAEEKYAVGTVVTGKVARMTDFGAFVVLEPGIDALLHVSQIALERIEKPADVLKVGEEITAKVVDFKPADKKISLSIKAYLKDQGVEAPAAEEAVEEVAEEAEAATEE
ncbi:4-hydroxy-3-methylbut-2-enyl diphosphate reductase [Eubacterium ruminantium]|nr:4-hydroxy-3-methylbut-2-enyl diphosphate reductase [Eubacterium ruminantium]